VRLRPTIPLADWRIAIHIEATKTVQNQPGTPAYGCECPQCRNWRLAADEILPPELMGQLRRLGIDPSRPTDLYATTEEDGYLVYRVMYHVVGRLLSGPNIWRDYGDDRMKMYRPFRSKPWLSLMVLPYRQSYTAGPVLQDKKAGEILQIDFRLDVPKILAEF